MHIQMIKMANAPFAHADACCITSKKRQECLPQRPQRLLSNCPSQRLQCGVLGRPSVGKPPTTWRITAFKNWCYMVL